MSSNVGEVPHIFLFSSVVKSELEIVVEGALEALGFDLVDLRRAGSRARPTVEIRIDRRDGTQVTVEDCARVSRAVEALVGDNTELQVSSPGADRPLKTERDWRRFVGRRALVKSAALGGRKEVEIVEVSGSGDVVVTLREVRKEKDLAEYRLALSAIDEARLTFHWDRGVTDGRFR
jgi:ribosome maturation factor RimP